MTTPDRLLGIARAWFDDATVASVFEPLVADWDHEARGLRGRRRWWSCVRVWTAFAVTFACALPWQVKRRVSERVLLSGWIAVELFALAGIALQIWFFYDGFNANARHLIPAALSVALPLALVPAAVIASSVARARRGDARVMTLRLALIVVVVLIPLITWLVPISNQTWREAARPDQPIVLRGDHELTLVDLFASRRPADVMAGEPWSAMRTRELANRAALLLMPLTLSVFGLSLGAHSVKRAGVVAIVAWALAGALWLSVTGVGWSAHAALLICAAACRRVSPCRRTSPPLP